MTPASCSDNEINTACFHAHILWQLRRELHHPWQSYCNRNKLPGYPMTDKTYPVKWNFILLVKTLSVFCLHTLMPFDQLCMLSVHLNCTKMGLDQPAWNNEGCLMLVFRLPDVSLHSLHMRRGTRPLQTSVSDNTTTCLVMNCSLGWLLETANYLLLLY